MNIKKFLHDAGFWYFSEFAPPGPEVPTAPRRDETTRQQSSADDKLHRVGNFTFKKEDEPTDHADTEWTNLGVKKSIFTPATLKGKEIDAIKKSFNAPDRTKRFQLIPYKNIKGCQDAGMSIKETCKILTETYGAGYSESNISRYRSFIKRVNSSNLSPTDIR